jgi:hypothetical protein
MEIKKLYRQLHLLYFRYKDSPYFSISLYGGIILVSLLLTVLVILPQLQSWFSLQDEIQQTRERIQIIRTNNQFLINLDPVLLENDYALATTALPSQRDASLLVAAINYAALTSGVALGDFSFQAGEQSGQSTSVQDVESNSKISFTVQGDFAQIVALISQLEEKLPLLSIDSIDAQFDQSNASQLTVAYYAKELPLIPNNDTVPLKDISPEARILLDTLKGWQVPTIEFPNPTGSTSAVFTPL